MKRILIVLMVVAILTSTIFTTTAGAVTVNDEQQEENPYLFEYEDREYIVPPISLNREPRVSSSGYVEKYTEVPHFFQTFYPDVMYGNTSVRQGGCGITCVAMVFTYLLDREIKVEDLASKYFRYKGKDGSSYSLFQDSAKDYGIEVSGPIYDWEVVKESLEDGHVIIANPRKPSIFTEGGHFIVLSGLTEDNKIIVKDPNLYNYSIWNYDAREEGYANGFEEKYIKSCIPCWIYEIKDIEKVATQQYETE